MKILGFPNPEVEPRTFSIAGRNLTARPLTYLSLSILRQALFSFFFLVYRSQTQNKLLHAVRHMPRWDRNINLPSRSRIRHNRIIKNVISHGYFSMYNYIEALQGKYVLFCFFLVRFQYFLCAIYIRHNRKWENKFDNQNMASCKQA